MNRVLPGVVAHNLDFINTEFFESDGGQLSLKSYRVPDRTDPKAWLLERLADAEAVTLRMEGEHVVANLTRYGLAASQLSFVDETLEVVDRAGPVPAKDGASSSDASESNAG